MSRWLFIAASIVLFAYSICQASGVEPESGLNAARSAVERFVALNNSGGLDTKEGRALRSGELRNPPPDPGIIPSPDKLVVLPNGRVVARIPGETGQRPDIYFNLDRTSGGRWTVSGFRLLAIPMFIPLEMEEILKHNTKSSEDIALLKQFDLALGTDQSLKRWFRENRSALERLRAISSASATDKPNALDEWRVESGEGKRILNSLGASSATWIKPGASVVTIGGILDNTVGFIWTSGSVPEIINGEYIWLEPVDGGWYFFKTT